MPLLRTLAALLVLAPAAAAAQTRPDFAGTWVLDASRSKLPQTTVAAVLAYTYPRTVTQSDREIRMVVLPPPGAPTATPQTFRFTSIPNTMTAEIEGRVVRSERFVQWENDAVVQTMTRIVDGQSMGDSRDILRLEDNGRTMTFTRELTMPTGEVRQMARYVYVRQN